MAQETAIHDNVHGTGFRARYTDAERAYGSAGSDRPITASDVQHHDLDLLRPTGSLVGEGKKARTPVLHVVALEDLIDFNYAFQRVTAYDQRVNWENHNKDRELALLAGLRTIYKSLKCVIDADGTLVSFLGTRSPITFSLGNGSNNIRCFGVSAFCILVNGGTVWETPDDVSGAIRYTPACQRSCRPSGLTTSDVVPVELPGLVPRCSDGRAAFRKRWIKERAEPEKTKFGHQRNGVHMLVEGSTSMTRVHVERLLNMLQFVAVHVSNAVYSAAYLPAEVQRFQCREPLARLSEHQCAAIRTLVTTRNTLAGGAASQRCEGESCNYDQERRLYTDLLYSGECNCVTVLGNAHCRHVV